MQATITPRGSGARVLASVLLTLSVLLAPGLARAQDPIPLEPVEDPAYGIMSVVPEAWQPAGQGLHVRRSDPADPTLLALQSAPVPMTSVWPTLLRQLDLTEVPEPAGTRTTTTFEWTLYQVDVDVPAGTLRVDLAVAEDGGTTYLVLLQSPIDGSAPLRDAVFLPAVDAFQPLAPEPTPDPATLPYDLEEVSFTGGSPEVTLAGTLSLPRGEAPHPAIVLFSGSGAQDRDESLRPVAAIKPFALLADALTRAGIAVLRYDDRGTAQSTGDYTSAGLADLTSDARAAFEYLRGRSEIDPARTGVLGHSEGGIYAASLVEAGVPMAFIVSLAGPATNGVDLMIAQNRAIVRSGGASEEELAAVEVFAGELYAEVLAGDRAGARAVAERYYREFWDRQPEDVRSALGDRATFVETQSELQVEGTSAPWFTDLLRSDAGVGWAKAAMPVLGIFAGKDVQVLASQNAPLMESALAGGHPASRVVTLPDANHLFQAAETGALAEYGTLEQSFTPDLLPLLVGWVAEQVGLPAPGGSPGPSADPLGSPSVERSPVG